MLKWAINGRFLSQPLTGVQRYAREVVAQIDTLLTEERATGKAGDEVFLLLPRGVPVDLPLQSIRPLELGSRTGPAWEQLEVPFHWRFPLLNLGNSGPVLKRDNLVCIHDANVFAQPASYSHSFRLLYRVMLPYLGRTAARLFTVSKDAAQQLRRFGIDPDGRAVVAPNGHEHVYAWHDEKSSILSRLPEKPFVLLIGSNAPHKNVGMVLRLAPALDKEGIDIVVVGRALSVLADSHSTAYLSNVHHVGGVSDDDLAALLKHALCLCFPSLTEGFGLPVLEAFALGCPVVSSNRASLPELCGDGALVLPPDDEVGWLEAVRRLYADVELAQTLRARGHRRALLYSWRTSAEIYVEAMRSIAGSDISRDMESVDSESVDSRPAALEVAS